MRNDTDPDLEHLAEEQGSHCQTQKCCHSLNLPGEKYADTQVEGRFGIFLVVGLWTEGVGAADVCWSTCIYLILPVHLPVCSRDRVGCRGHIWLCVPPEAFLPDLPRVSSCGGLTPPPRCPAEDCNAGAGALNNHTMQYTHKHVSRVWWN